MKSTAASVLIITVLLLVTCFGTSAQAVASTDVNEAEDLDPAVSRRDPYSIVMTAKQKQSPLKGTVPKDNSLNLPAIPTKIPDTVSQIPDTLSQLKDQVDTTLRAQPERLRTAIGTQRLQQQWQMAIGSMKTKLRNLIKRVESTAHQTAENLK